MPPANPTQYDSYFTIAPICSLISVLLLTALITQINIIAPISGDLWYCSTQNGYHVSALQLIQQYIKNFNHGNPRIGELFLVLGCQSWPWRVAVKTGGTIVFFIAVFTITFGRLPRIYCFLDCTMILLLFAGIWTSTIIPGKLLFYDPYLTNYVLGYAVLLIFLLPYRFLLTDQPIRQQLTLVFAMPVLGVLAGLTNEHTPPVIIVLLAVAIAVYIPGRASRIRLTWMLSGWSGLVIGYILLFFAPGQYLRYGGIKYEQMSGSLLIKSMTFAAEIHRVLENSYFFIGLACGLLAVTWFARRTYFSNISVKQTIVSKEVIYASIFGVMAAFGTLAVLPFSPVLDDRLYFPAAVNLVLVCCFVIYQLARQSMTLTTIIFILVTMINSYYLVEARAAYIAFREQFQARESFILSQRAAGRMDVVIPDYQRTLDKYGRFLRLDANNPTTNGLMARYYGVDDIVIISDNCANNN